MEFLCDSDDETDMGDESEPEPDTELDETQVSKTDSLTTSLNPTLLSPMNTLYIRLQLSNCKTSNTRTSWLNCMWKSKPRRKPLQSQLIKSFTVRGH